MQLVGTGVQLSHRHNAASQQHQPRQLSQLSQLCRRSDCMRIASCSLRLSHLPLRQCSAASSPLASSLRQAVASRGSRLRCFAAASLPAMDTVKKLMHDPDLFKSQALIGGVWSDADDGSTVDVSLPSSHPMHASINARHALHFVAPRQL